MTGALPFIFGGNTPWTYEEVQRQRAIANSLRQANMGTPRNVGEGLAAIGRALGARRRENKAATREEELKAEMQAQIAAALGGGAGMAGITTPGVRTTGLGADPNSPQGIADATMAALGRPAVNETSQRIKAGLVERGLPEHVADAFVLNFQSESGLDSGINEAAPMVPGSRGGFGLAQWTGPRRVALERFAAARGVPASDESVQLDFLMQELSGPEAAAGSVIMGAPDRATAADAILRQFLRPAPENVAARSAEYAGAKAPGGMTAEIAALLANPMLPPDVRQALVMQATPPAPMSEMDQIELAQARLNLEQDMAMPASDAGRAAPAGPEYGLTPQYATDKDGNLVLLQLAKDGTAKQTVLPDGVALQKGLEKVDLGTTWQWYNTLTGEAVGAPIAKNVGAAAAEAAAGKELGVDTALLESMNSKMPGLETVVAQLGDLAQKATYTVVGKAVDAVKRQVGATPSEGALARAQYTAMVDNQVLPMLRDTFGAAFTVKEGETLRATLGGDDKSPEEKQAILTAFIAQKRRDVEALAMRVGGALSAGPMTASAITAMTPEAFNAWIAGVDVMTLPDDVISAALARSGQ